MQLALEHACVKL